MKRFVLCILLALLTLISSAAFAENANCRACCSAACSTSDSASTAYVPKYDDADYTLEVDQYDFKFFLPSTFEADPVSPDHYRSVYGSQYPYIIIEPDPNEAYFPGNKFYTDREWLRRHLVLSTLNSSDSEVIHMDECLGYMYVDQRINIYNDNVIYWATIKATNRKDICVVTVISDTLDEALDLAHAIINHAVAKEIPLDELDQAE